MQFQETNKGFCEEFERDMARREDATKEREDCAVVLRKKGNQLFGKKRHKEALLKYAEALTKSPYQIEVLTNLALVSSKLEAWTDSLEYCDRALHIDRSCAKAAFLRHKVHIALGNKASALEDISRCIEMEPDNADFANSRYALSHELESEDIQSELGLTVDANLSLAVEGSSVPKVTLDDIMFVVTTKKGDTCHGDAVQRQRRIIDSCIRILETKTFGPIDTSKTQTEFNLMEDACDLCSALCFHKLKKCLVACTYLRASGYFEKILQRVMRLTVECMDKTQVVNCETKEATCLLGIVTETINVDFLARKVLVEVSSLLCVSLIHFISASF